MKEEVNTPVDLMLKRIIVTGDYPCSPYNIGDVIECTDTDRFVLYVTKEYCDMTGDYEDVSHYTWFKVIEKYPLLFREAQWWEHRQPEDMPEYYKRIGDGTVYKTGCRVEGRIVMLQIEPTKTVPTAIEYLLPSTKEEYFNQTINPVNQSPNKSTYT